MVIEVDDRCEILKRKADRVSTGKSMDVIPKPIVATLPHRSVLDVRFSPTIASVLTGKLFFARPFEAGE
jgi:hypothetical protein